MAVKQSAKPFWVIISDQAGRCADYQTALTRAEELAAAHPYQQFFILRSVTAIEAKPDVMVEEISFS